MAPTDVLADHPQSRADSGGLSAAMGSGNFSVHAPPDAAGQAGARHIGGQPRDGGARSAPPRQEAEGSGHATRDASAVQRPTKLRLCRYFGLPSGCRAGANCPFLHEPARLPAAPRVNDDGTSGAATATGQGPPGDSRNRRQAVTKSPASRVVAKPIPPAQTQDPREFQLGQIRRRFSPKETRSLGSDGAETGTVLSFSMAPSDPDFPFEMDALQCSLIVPLSYPGADDVSKPKFKVTNKDMPRGFAINIERGFDSLVEQRSDATLLSLMTALDKNLEKFLSEKKAETIKLVANADTRHPASMPVRSGGLALQQLPEKMATINPQPSTIQAKPKEVFSAEQKAWARGKRERDTRQLEARMGRLPLYRKSSDGNVYTLPLEPFKRSELPLPLQAIKTVRLIVPMLYPLIPCRIGLDGVNLGDATVVELTFERHAIQEKDMTLMAHLQHLTHNIRKMVESSPKADPEVSRPIALEKETTPGPSQPSMVSQASDDDRSHIKVIPRPPEWGMIDTSDVSDPDEDYSYDTGDDLEDRGIEAGYTDTADVAASPAAPADNPERGTALSFPFLELHGIELLEVTTLNLTIKCERCKDTMDVSGLRTDSPKTESCKKCAAVLKVGFRRDLIHAHAVRAGFFDLEGCTIVDMLPSTFLPTCSNCSTSYPAPGLVSVRGETTTAMCRTCHQKLTFSIPSVKFLRITAAAVPSASGPRRKRETLGLVTGTELPDRGRCKHYSKSYRWFRFSCCAKVYPCDRCHDAKEEHPNEHANRMICGWCSREQSYRPEECAFCGKGVVGRKGSGFWEGGKGTRDRVRMSRKDPRKHKRVGGANKTKA